MKFKFNYYESIVNDFIRFPKVCFYEELIKNLDFNESEAITSENYYELLRNIGEKITIFQKEIEFFYQKNFYDFDFIDIIAATYRTKNHNHPKSYLEMLDNLNDTDITEALVYAFLEIEAENEKVSRIEAKLISENHERILKLINELNIDPAFKWNLFLIIQEPKKYLQKYLNLMEKMLPIFEDFYQDFYEELKSYGNYFVNYLNVNGPSAIEEISDSLVNKDIFVDEVNEILISMVFQYSIRVMEFDNSNTLVWGFKVEEGLKKVKEQYNHKLNQRIQIFKNLSDKTRYEVLKYIGQNITSTKELAKLTGVSSATISYHLNALLNSKLIKISNFNRKFSYVVDYEVIEEVLKDFKNDLNGKNN